LMERVTGRVTEDHLDSSESTGKNTNICNGTQTDKESRGESRTLYSPWVVSPSAQRWARYGFSPYVNLVIATTAGEKLSSNFLCVVRCRYPVQIEAAAGVERLDGKLIGPHWEEVLDGLAHGYHETTMNTP